MKLFDDKNEDNEVYVVDFNHERLIRKYTFSKLIEVNQQENMLEDVKRISFVNEIFLNKKPRWIEYITLGSVMRSDKGDFVVIDYNKEECIYYAVSRSDFNNRNFSATSYAIDWNKEYQIIGIENLEDLLT